MLRISQKPLVLVVTMALASSYAELSHANPTHSATKPSTVKSKPKVSTTTDSLTDLYETEETSRKRTGHPGHREHKNRGERGGGRRKDDIPNFRKVKTLESLTPVQEAKVTHILKAQREKSLPFSEKLREIREASSDSSDSDSDTGRRRKNPEIAGLRMKIHAIKKDAWLQIQKILTPRQKIELEALQESGPPRRKHPDAQPAVHDSGKSFSR